MARNLSNYEPVKARKKRFYEEYKDGRINVEIVNTNEILEYALFKATIFKNVDDQKENHPLATGFAMEIRDKTRKVSNKGEQYESVNFTSWVENCEESAIGRALDNAGFASNMQCSREEIEKADRMNETLSNQETKQPTKKAEGDYIIPFGKYKDMSLNEIANGDNPEVSLGDIQSYVDYVEEEAKRNKKPISGIVKGFIEQVEKCR